MKASLLLELLLGGLVGCTHSEPTPTSAPLTIAAHVMANCPGIVPSCRVIANTYLYYAER